MGDAVRIAAGAVARVPCDAGGALVVHGIVAAAQVQRHHPPRAGCLQPAVRARCQLERLDRDFALMVRNAKQYNAPDSQVDRDAETLWGAFSEARAKTFPAAAQLPQRYDDEALL